MLQRIQTVLIWVSLVLLFLFSLVLVCLIPWTTAREFAVAVVGRIPESVQYLIPLVAVAVVLVIAALQVQRLRQTVLIVKETEEGTVTIVESAIARYIRQVTLEIESVRSVRSEIASTPQGLVVKLFAEVLVTDTLPRIEQTIRARVREALEQTLGVGGVAAIHVVIEGFQKVPPSPEPPRPTGEIKLTGESGAGAGAATKGSSIRWGRLLPRDETKEKETDATKPDEAKSGDVTGEPLG